MEKNKCWRRDKKMEEKNDREKLGTRKENEGSKLEDV